MFRDDFFDRQSRAVAATFRQRTNHRHLQVSYYVCSCFWDEGTVTLGVISPPLFCTALLSAWCIGFINQVGCPWLIAPFLPVFLFSLSVCLSVCPAFLRLSVSCACPTVGLPSCFFPSPHLCFKPEETCGPRPSRSLSLLITTKNGS